MMTTMNNTNFYVHSNPPKAISSTSNALRTYVKNADLDKLETVILEGQGARLLGLMESTGDVRVKAFLKGVPSYMAKVDLIHEAVSRGSPTRELHSLLPTRKLALSRDAVGRGLGHKAVLHGHRHLVDWLGKKYPEVMGLKDNEGRTPLHYTAALPNGMEFYNLLVGYGANKDVIDIHGHTPPYYHNHPGALDIDTPFSRSRNTPTSNLRSPTMRKLSSPSRAQIRIWIHERDIPKLEQIVWGGKGDKLLLETTNNSKVRKFLDNVPHLLKLIKEVHQASIKNDVETLKNIRKWCSVDEVFKAKDSNGLSALHKAVGLNNRGVVEWFLYEFEANPEDSEDDVPLMSLCKDEGLRALLQKAGFKSGQTNGHSYDLDGKYLRNVPDAPRVVGSLGQWERGNGSGNSYSGGGGGLGNNSPLGKKRKQEETEFEDEFDEDNKRRVAMNGGTPQSEIVIEDVADNYMDEGISKYDLNPDEVKMDLEVYEDDLEAEEEDGGEEGDGELEKELEKLKEDEEGEALAMQEQQIVENGGQQAEEELKKEEENHKVDEAQKELEVEREPEEPEQEVPQGEAEEPLEEARQGESETVQEEAVVVEDAKVKNEEPTLMMNGDYNPEEDPGNALEELSLLPKNYTEEDVTEMINNSDMENLVSTVLDGHGSLLLESPASTNDPSVTEFLNNVPAYMAKIASIHSAAYNGNLRDLQALLDRKRLAYARDERGRVALHMAVLGGNQEVIRYLLGAGFYGEGNVNICDTNSRTPLHYASALNDNGTVYRLLTEAGGNPNFKDSKNNTPSIYLRRKDLISLNELLNGEPDGENNEETFDQWERPPTPQEDQGNNPPEVEEIGVMGEGAGELSEIDPQTLQTLDTFYTELTKPESMWVRTWNKLLNKPDQRLLAKNYLLKYLPQNLYDKLKYRSTPRYNHTLLDCIKFYPQYFLVAPDANAYSVWREVFVEGAVKAHNKRGRAGFLLLGNLDGSTDPEKEIGGIDPAAKFVREARLKVTRNLRGYAFVAGLSRDGLGKVRHKIEGNIAEVVDGWVRVDMAETEDNKDDEAKKSWKREAVEVEATKLSRFWPKHRIVYISPDKTKQIWIHSEDHLDFIVKSCYGKIGKLLREMDTLYRQIRLDYEYSSEVGWLTVDPFRAGTGMKITLRMRLPQLMRDRATLTRLCAEEELCISKWKSGVDEIDDWVEIENVVTWGESEVEIGKGVVQGVGKLIKVEETMEREENVKMTKKKSAASPKK